MSRSYKSSLVSQKHLNALKRIIEVVEYEFNSSDERVIDAKAALKSVRRLNREIRLERRRPTPH